MTLEEAIVTALEYENKVVAVYADAVDSTSDVRGRQVLRVLADEERGHVAYLEKVLERWQVTGKLDVPELGSSLPSVETIQAGVEKLQRKMAPAERPSTAETELALLSQALEVEIATADFYREVVGQLGGEERELFRRFLQIEEGHRAIVQAEIDAVSGTGYWFDFQEFDLEAA